MSKDEKPVLGEKTKKVLDNRKQNDVINKESIGRNVGNTIKAADLNALKKNQEERRATTLKKGKENEGKKWVEKTNKQQHQEPQSQYKPSALQMKAQEQQRAQNVKQQEQRSKESISKESTSALQQKAQKATQVKKQTEVKKAPPAKGRGK
jgi:hypothetical protein